MIDKKHTGATLPQHFVALEAGRLRFFAKAIGESDPVYTDESAARAAGYNALPAPPTFLFSLDLERVARACRTYSDTACCLWPTSDAY